MVFGKIFFLCFIQKCRYLFIFSFTSSHFWFYRSALSRCFIHFLSFYLISIDMMHFIKVTGCQFYMKMSKKTVIHKLTSAMPKFCNFYILLSKLVICESLAKKILKCNKNQWAFHNLQLHLAFRHIKRCVLIKHTICESLVKICATKRKCRSFL